VTAFGAATAIAIYALSILVFALRIAGAAVAAKRVGVAFLLTAVPLFVLIAFGLRESRAPLYFAQIGLMLAFLAVTFLFDYWPTLDFRGRRWIVIPYVMLFFAGTGGMLGVASHAGPGWTAGALAVFFPMAVLAFVQRRITGA
jgi:hypothetical protein